MELNKYHQLPVFAMSVYYRDRSRERYPNIFYKKNKLNEHTAHLMAKYQHCTRTSKVHDQPWTHGSIKRLAYMNRNNSWLYEVAFRLPLCLDAFVTTKVSFIHTQKIHVCMHNINYIKRHVWSIVWDCPVCTFNIRQSIGINSFTCIF